MAAQTAITWCNATFNPWIGCSKVAPGCTNCYAEADMDHRRGRVKWGPFGTRSRTSDNYWKQPLRWNRQAEAAGGRRRVFCASLADVFEQWDGPIVDAAGNRLKESATGDIAPREQGDYGPSSRWLTMSDLRRDLFALIDRTPKLDWLLLTKRPENVLRMWDYSRKVKGHVSQNEGDGIEALRKNCWLGCSVSDQATADAAIPHLLKCRDLCPVLFVSAEPLLGPVNLHLGKRDDGRPWERHLELDWLIIGGESGRNARPCNLDWIRDLVRQCREAGVPCFMKQLGSNVLCDLESTDDGWPEGTVADPQGRYGRIQLRDSKGGDPSKWPADLRVTQWPTAHTGTGGDHRSS